jgi:hypothetical protein
VVTPQNPHYITTSDTPLPPVTTFLPKHSPNSDSAAGGDKTNNSQSEKSFENRGGNTLPTESKDLTPQGIETVTTSPRQGGNTTPQCPETPSNAATAQSKFRGEKLANQMREAIAKGSREDAKEVMERVASSALQIRGFFNKSFSKEEVLNIRLLRDFDLTKGTRVEYIGKDTEQYAGEVLTVDSVNSQNELACLRPDGKGYTTWLKLEDLCKL